MYKFLYSLFLIFCSLFSYSQNVGIGTALPDSTAALEIKDSARGFLPPRLSTQQRNAITNPAEGLQIFNTTNSIPEVYSNGEWRPFGSFNNYYYNDNIYDQQGLIQSDSLDYSCVVTAAQQAFLKIMDFECDSLGNQVYFLTYAGKQRFYGQTLDCIDGGRRYVIMKLSKTGSLIWIQNFNLTGSQSAVIVSAKVDIMNDGNIMLALSHYIGLGVTTTYSYNLGSRLFSFNNYYGNLIKLDASGQYIANKTLLGANFNYFELNQNQAGGYVYLNVIAGGTYAGMINCNAANLSTIWQNQFSNSNIFSVGVHPSENSIYYTYSINSGINAINFILAKYSSTGSQNLLTFPSALGALTTSGVQNAIAFSNNNIHLYTPNGCTLNFNNQNYNGFLHLVISRVNSTLLNVINENTSDGLNYGLMKSTGNYVAEIAYFKQGAGLQYLFFHSIQFKIFDDTGIVKYSGVNIYDQISASDPVNIIKIGYDNSNLLLVGNYGNYSNAGNFSLLNFNLPSLGLNSYNPFVFYLNLPN